MVNAVLTNRTDPLRDLALSYAPPEALAGMAALLSLDAALGQILRTTSEPMVGQMRLAWWREALARLDSAPPPAEPVLNAVANDALPLGAVGAELSRMADGWERLLGEIDDDGLTSFAGDRGATLFEQAGRVIGAGPGDPLTAAGRGWALADLAANIGDAKVAERARVMAKQAFAGMAATRWSRRGRTLGALALAARLALEGNPKPWWVMRLGWHRLRGR
jgi:15-cis-phytoene synthase